MATSSIDLRIRQARRRLFTQTLLNRLGLAWGCALALGLIWILAGPFLLSSGPDYLKWTILASAGLLGTGLAIWTSIRKAPSQLSAALALDQRFELKERVTTALGLTPHELSSPAGQALLEDANTRLEMVAVKGKFPVRLGWRALFLPAQAAAIAILALYPPAVLTSLAGGGNKKDSDEGAIEETEKPKQAIPRQFIKPPIERPNKSEELKQLEAELEKLYAEHNKEIGQEKEKPEKVRDRQEKIASAEEKLKKREQDMAEKFQRLQEQMDKITELDNGEARKDGPAKDFEDAMAKGDLQKAQEEVDRLKKKAKEKKLDQKDQDQLKDQLKQMEDKVDRLQREQEKKKQQLKDLVDKAKKEGRDADSLERELQKMEQEQQMTKEMQDLAKSMKAARQALEMKDFDGLADQLDQVSKELGGIQEELQDLEDVQEHLQNLKQMKKEGCKECEGEGKKEKGENGSEKDNAKGYAEGASGKRPENKDAKTKEGEEKRIRGFFDPKGKKTYGGATNGPAFKKSSSAEIAGEIQQAVQDAPEAVEVQRLPKGAKDMVKEYFEKLGGQAPPPPAKK